MKRLVFVISVFLIGTVIAVACAAPEPASPDSDELYTTRCAACHGVNREGVTGLGPTLTPESLVELSDDDIRDMILNGRSGTVMTAFKGILSPEQIDILLRLIKYTSP